LCKDNFLRESKACPFPRENVKSQLEMSRPDLTDSVIHFIRAPTDAEAWGILINIVREGKLRGGSGLIKGGYVCVCFAELSRSLAAIGFTNAAGNSRYTRYGVMVPKDWLFAQGGRPVIYQPDFEFALLPESHRWRHVTFNLGNDPVDFTWEREWRIQCEGLLLDPGVVSFIVPSQAREEALRSDFEREEHFSVQLYSLVMGDLAEGYRRSFDWKIEIVQPISPLPP
jgi:hypothetical protein